MIKTKIFLLTIASIVYFSSFIASNDVSLGVCLQTDFRCRDTANFIQGILVFAPLFIFVAVVTLFFNAKYYKSWLRFAWWGGPFAIGIIMLVNAGFHHTSGGWMNLDDILDNEITYLAYTFFVIGSLIQIWRAYRTR